VVVQRLSADGNRQTAPFDVEGDRVRITARVDPTSQDPADAGITVYLVEADTRDNAGSANFEGGGTDSSILNVGPGSYFLDTNTANAEYEVVVEDCRGSAPADDEDDDSDADEQAPVQEKPKEVVQVVVVRKGPLPDTGGPALTPLAAAVAALAGAAGFAATRRRD
jgi:hypothetical protein